MLSILSPGLKTEKKRVYGIIPGFDAAGLPPPSGGFLQAPTSRLLSLLQSNPIFPMSNISASIATTPPHPFIHPLKLTVISGSLSIISNNLSIVTLTDFPANNSWSPIRLRIVSSAVWPAGIVLILLSASSKALIPSKLMKR